MNIKNILYGYFFVALSFLSWSCASVDGDDVNRQTGLPNAVYFSGVDTSPMTKIIVNESGAKAEISLRSANLVTASTTVSIEVDEAALADYNGKYGTSYKLLPEQYYTLSAKQTSIRSGSVMADAIEVNIKPEASELNASIKYALPLRIKDSSSSELPVLASAATKIIGLDRVLKTSAIRQAHFFLKMKFPTPIALKEWTIQYGMKVDRLFDNQSVLSPDFYSRITRSGSLQVKVGETDDPKGFLKQRLVPGKWYHIALVYKGQHIKAYLNGVLDTEFDVPPVETFSKFNFSWGKFSGYVRDVRLYSKALSPFLIRENLYVEDPSNPDLVVYYPLTKETGLNDVTKNGYHFQALVSEGTTYRGTLTWAENISFPESN